MIVVLVAWVCGCIDCTTLALPTLTVSTPLQPEGGVALDQTHKVHSPVQRWFQVLS